MLEKTNRKKIDALIKLLGENIKLPIKVYFTGGATAVLLGFRNSTIDIDLKFVPDSDEALKLIPQLKEKLMINIELASPSDFIPELPNWEERSLLFSQVGKVAFFHYDFYSQVLD